MPPVRPSPPGSRDRHGPGCLRSVGSDHQHERFVRLGHNDDPDEFVHAIAGPEGLLLLVAGGTGLYSTVMPSWGGGAHRNVAVTKVVELDQACEVPREVALR